jgi:hypothetical protein
VLCCNGIEFADVDRFIHPVVPHEVRGWVGHQFHWRWFYALDCSIVFGVVQPDNWANPSRGLAVKRFDLSADHPNLLEIPPGFAAASMAVSEAGSLLVLSSANGDPGDGDGFYFPPEHWSIPRE